MCGLLNQPSLGAMARQQLRLVLGDLRKLPLQGFGDGGVNRAPALAQQCAIGGVLDQRMFEQIARMRRRALAEQQTSGNETVKRRFQLWLWFPRYRSQEGMRKLPSDRGTDLRQFLGGPEPVEPRHQ